PVATIAGSARFGFFTDEDTLALLRDKRGPGSMTSPLQVYSFANGVAQLTTEHEAQLNDSELTGHASRRGLSVYVQQNEGWLKLHSLATNALVVSACFDPRGGYVDSVELSKDVDYVALARRERLDDGEKARERVEVRAFKKSERVRRFDLGDR